MAHKSLESIASSKVVAFVHAKGTSERLPGKNLRVLGDRPLFCHAIRNAREAKLVDAVVIDSDSDDILRIGEEHGAIPWKRPPGLATNETTGDDLAWWQAMICPEAKAIVQVVPTCPFTRPESINVAIAWLNKYASAVGVLHERRYTWASNKPQYYRDKWIPNTQDMIGVTRETTGLYAVHRSVAAADRCRLWAADCKFVWQQPIEAIDIDTQDDWDLAELVWKGMHACWRSSRR